MADFPRHEEPRVRAALRDSRIVAITGPRQAGKSTLARTFVRNDRPYITFDDHTALAAARSDPAAFIRRLDCAVIDEVQRAPEILFAIKQQVDTDRRPGRFLLTGSADLASIATVRDSLAGRLETIPLYPLSRSELLRNKRTTFLTLAFKGKIPSPAETLAPDTLTQLASLGGYPEAVGRRTERRRQDWYREYIQAMAARDAAEISPIARPDIIPRLMQLLCRHAGQLVNLTELGRTLGIDHKTVDRYVQVMEQLYIVQRVQPWLSNELSRLIKTPKLHFVDSGLLCALRGHPVGRLRTDPALFGPVLETLVFSELLKGTSRSTFRIAIHHYRDKDQREVDFVLEDEMGKLVGIEVKAAATVGRKDFAGLDRLAAAAGERFVQGILLYDGDQTLSFSDNLHAAPMSCLWA